LLRKMLPVVAMLVGGYLSRQGGGAAQSAGPAGGLSGGGLGDLLGGLLGGQKGGSMGLASLLDMDGDGNPLDDILGMAGKIGR
jgi:hypothetical protein